MAFKVIIAPDKFKGSLSSFDICRVIADSFKKFSYQFITYPFPLSDGGDGFASVLKHYLETITIACVTKDPLERTISSSYEWDENSATAIIELASASGLALLRKQEQNPLQTSTYGTGLLIANALTKGAKKIILGIGGSATNDAGIGILAALGFVFLNKDEQSLSPVGANLSVIEKIIPPTDIPAIDFEIACDVTNTLYGINGAAAIYAPQKGAKEDEVRLLDEGLQNFAARILQQTGKDIAHIPGTGAAGGVAAGLMAFFNVSLVSGAEKIIGISQIENYVCDADLIITGEGKIDAQTGSGKVIGRVAALGKKYGVPVIAICGNNELPESIYKEIGLDAVHQIVDATDKEESMKFAAVFLNRKIKIMLPELERYLRRE